ncbi:MAG: helix-turn-helix domain-containing protein [Polaromonas sp.]|nr:helix-turn-helix domain-containing protein [Polaromonas sp.]
MNLDHLLAEQAAAAAAPDRSGTQSLSRGIKLMRMVASRPQFGWRISDLAAACNMDRGTVHRMLVCMTRERLVEQRESDRHYLPGPLMHELGLALPDRAQFERRAQVTALAFANRMGGVALLVLRSGNEYVCSLRVGALPLSGSVIYQGTRRPLFTSACGVAILQTLAPDDAREVLLDNVAQEIARCGTGRLASLQRMRERSDRHGFGVNLGDVVPGVHAFSVPVRSGNGETFASLSLLGTPELYGEARIDELRAELFTAASLLEADAQKFNL